MGKCYYGILQEHNFENVELHLYIRILISTLNEGF